VILVDDLRIIRKTFPWGERSYGKIDFLKSIKERIIEINKGYQFTTLNGHIEDDVLMAYIPPSKNRKFSLRRLLGRN